MPEPLAKIEFPKEPAVAPAPEGALKKSTDIRAEQMKLLAGFPKNIATD